MQRMLLERLLSQSIDEILSGTFVNDNLFSKVGDPPWSVLYILTLALVNDNLFSKVGDPPLVLLDIYTP